MLAVRHIGKCIMLATAVAIFFSCDPWFAYSPYEVQLEKSYSASTEKNLAKIEAGDAGGSKAFKVALLSDPHYHFGKLDDAVMDISAKNDFAFAIVTGDLTDNGLKQEFIFFHESMENLTIPFITAIGNHDYLSNGEEIYSQMFGAYNYSFVFNNVKFVLFDNTTVESEKEPDFAWLDRELKNDAGYDHVIPLSHIPPYDGQMIDHQERYHKMMVDNNIRASFHGHTHDFSLEEFYGEGVIYSTVSSPQKRNYTALTITPTEIEIQKIDY
jgi:3',5'-cyclic-AMP phosphodiesterase